MNTKRIGFLNRSISLAVVSGIALAAPSANADCTMQTQLQTASQATLQARLNTINSNMQALSLLNSLETQCTQGLQSVPTQMIGSGLAATTYINKIAQSVCNGLAQQVRSTATSAMAQAQAAVQQQINASMSSVIQNAGGSGTLLGNATSSAVQTSSNGVISSAINSVMSMFK
ncbi:hypothetical protein AB4Y43_16890 [Paraburkholderia sp. BR10872]|uniref:hypothetical protein n=1 Tax=Paraburkholderia sp. BR10872 TaxID=3236989 RepID=UPI0034D28548